MHWWREQCQGSISLVCQCLHQKMNLKCSISCSDPSSQQKPLGSLHQEGYRFQALIVLNSPRAVEIFLATDLWRSPLCQWNCPRLQLQGQLSFSNAVRKIHQNYNIEGQETNLPIHVLRDLYLVLCLKNCQMFAPKSQENFPTHNLIQKKDLDGFPRDQKLSSQNWKKETIIMSIMDQQPLKDIEIQLK